MFSTKQPQKAYNKKPPEQKPKGKGVSDEKTIIEVIEIYPIKSNKYFKCTAHIYWENKNIDLRGIVISEYGDKKYFVQMPMGHAKDKEGNRTLFPYIHTPNPKELNDFLHAVQKEMKTYIPKWKEENLNSNP